jgi:hypothetical protein
MSLTPNLSPAARAFYAVCGIGLLVAAFTVLTGVWRWPAAAAGAAGLLEGAAGW